MGGGGDGGYGERQDKLDNSKQAARNALNVLFGIEPTVGATAAPDRAAFTHSTTGVATGGYTEAGIPIGGTPAQETTFDQAGYDAAVEAAKATSSVAVGNKSALDTLYSTTRDNAFTAGKRRLDEQKGTAGRDLKFELFARGQNGGSVDVDQNALLGRTYAQGVTDLGAKADATATQLRSDNEQARLGLLQSIDSGMDQSSALSSALGQMKVNADRSAADATGTALGDLFANSGLIYQQNRVAQGKQNAITAAAANAANSSPFAVRGTSGSLSRG